MKKILKQMLALCFTLSLMGCSQSSSEVIELSKNKYKADSNGYVYIKGKLIENDLILNVKDDDDLLETQHCDVQDNGKFTISLKFNEIINNDTPEVTIYTTYEGEEYRKKVKVNIKDYIDSIYQKDEEEKKEQEQLENEKSDLESYKGKTVTEFRTKAKELGYSVQYIYQPTQKDYTDYVNESTDEFMSSWVVVDLYINTKKKDITVYVKGI
mgnify:CR=1 FL=1|jgi:hypothetical protein|nr:MAG TPA: protein of unknown function (DUF5016) [Caudoviricetes sp.]